MKVYRVIDGVDIFSLSIRFQYFQQFITTNQHYIYTHARTHKYSIYEHIGTWAKVNYMGNICTMYNVIK